MIRRLVGNSVHCMFSIDIELLQRLPAQNNNTPNFQLINYCNAEITNAKKNKPANITK